jgi:hypothetical protein
MTANQAHKKSLPRWVIVMSALDGLAKMALLPMVANVGHKKVVDGAFVGVGYEAERLRLLFGASVVGLGNYWTDISPSIYRLLWPGKKRKNLEAPSEIMTRSCPYVMLSLRHRKGNV